MLHGWAVVSMPPKQMLGRRSKCNACSAASRLELVPAATVPTCVAVFVAVSGRMHAAEEVPVVQVPCSAGIGSATCWHTPTATRHCCLSVSRCLFIVVTWSTVA
jgi:hypothetical protein